MGSTGAKLSWPAAAGGAACKEVGVTRSPQAATVAGYVLVALHTACIRYERATLSR